MISLSTVRSYPADTRIIKECMGIHREGSDLKMSYRGVSDEESERSGTGGCIRSMLDIHALPYRVI